MATATSTNILTPEFIKERIVLADDQNWAFRSLILLVRYMESDLTGYRNSLGKIENRNSPRYWMDWMSRSLINRTMRVSDCARHTPAVFNDPKWFFQQGRPLTGTHLNSLKEFFSEPTVCQTVYDLATGKIALPTISTN